MYGDAAKKLVLDAKRSLNLNDVPLFQADLVKDVIREIDDLNKDAEYLTLQIRSLIMKKLTRRYRGFLG